MLIWPSIQRIGKDIRASSSVIPRRASDVISGACSTAMTGDRPDEIAAMDPSMIAVALTPSWLVLAFALVRLRYKPSVKTFKTRIVHFVFHFEDFRLCAHHNNVNYGAWHVYKPLFGSSVAPCQWKYALYPNFIIMNVSAKGNIWRSRNRKLFSRWIDWKPSNAATNEGTGRYTSKLWSVAELTDHTVSL